MQLNTKKKKSLRFRSFCLPNFTVNSHNIKVKLILMFEQTCSHGTNYKRRHMFVLFTPVGVNQSSACLSKRLQSI